MLSLDNMSDISSAELSRFQQKDIDAFQDAGANSKKTKDINPQPPDKPKFIFDRSKVNDESKGPSKPILEPLPGVDPDFEKSTRKTLDYLSRTGDLEFNTERTQTLQTIIDKMTGQDGKNERLMTVSSNKPVEARVVIKNKGEEDDAFVLPDGTIILSQSLIDKYNLTLDEVGGVIAHEINHIRTETAKKINASGGHKFGVGWIHETTEDTLAPDLLVKAGLNSLGFSSAIIKISGSERGGIHQSGLSRGSLSVGQHFGLDYSTSAQEFTPLPEILKAKEPISKTNMEIITQLIQQKDVEKVEEMLPLLHPQDLFTAYQLIINQKKSIFNEKYVLSPEQKQIIESGNFYLNNLLKTAGYSETERNLFFIYTQGDNSSAPSFSMIRTPEMVLDAARELPNFILHGKLINMNYSLFAKENTQAEAKTFLEVLKIRMHDINVSPHSQHEIPITKDILLQTLININSMDEYKYNLEGWKKADLFTLIIDKYIYQNYYKEEANSKKVIDEPKIRELLQEVKDLNIPINPDHLTIAAWDFSEEQKVQGLFNEFFKKKEEEKGLEQSIDDFFDIFKGLEGESQRKSLSTFLEKFRETLNKNEVPDAQRINLISYFGSKVKEINLSSKLDLNHQLKLNVTNIQDKDRFQRNILEFNMHSNAALALFQKDGPEFYSYMTELMENSGIDIQNCSPDGIYNLCSSFFNIDNSALYNFDESSLINNQSMNLSRIKIENLNNFLQLPFLQHFITESERKSSCTNLKELNKIVLEISKSRLGRSRIIFNDSLYSLIGLKQIRENFMELMQKGITEDDYPELYFFLEKHYPPGPRKKEFLQEIHIRYLDRPIGSQAELEQKIDYLKKNFELIGPEGMSILANHINKMSHYLLFRKAMGDRLTSYLEGSTTIDIIAEADYASSFITGNFEKLHESSKTDKKTKKKLSTETAKAWFKMFFGGGYGARDVYIDKNTGQVELDGTSRTFFRSFSDFIKELKSLSELNRFAIAHKSLVDTGGALTDDKRRGQLGQILNESLGTSSSFIRQAIQEGCETAPAEFFSFPISKMFAPLLFRGSNSSFIE